MGSAVSVPAPHHGLPAPGAPRVAPVAGHSSSAATARVAAARGGGRARLCNGSEHGAAANATVAGRRGLPGRPRRRSPRGALACVPDDVLVACVLPLVGVPTEVAALAAVSRRWRALCLSPALWPALELDWFPGARRSAAALCRFAASPVMRGPLSRVERLSLGNAPVSAALLRLLRRHCPRLATLSATLCDGASPVRPEEDGEEAALGWFTEERFPRLRHLSLVDCTSIVCAFTLSRLSRRLTKVALTGCTAVNDAAVEQFDGVRRGWGSLRELDLFGCHDLTDDGVTRTVAAASQLQVLDLGLVSRLTDLAIRDLPASLTALGVGGCFNVSGDGLRAVALACTQLVKLDVSLCFDVDDGAVAAVARACTALASLCLRHCHAITDATLRELAAGTRHLRDLDVSYCSHITTNGVRKLARGCTQLKELQLNSCRRVTDGATLSLAVSCRQLERLELADCDRLGDLSCAHLATMPALTSLTLRGCERVTDAGLLALCGGGLAGLLALDVKRCPGVTPAGVACVRARMPRLRCVDVGPSMLTPRGDSSGSESGWESASPV